MKYLYPPSLTRSAWQYYERKEGRGREGGGREGEGGRGREGGGGREGERGGREIGGREGMRVRGRRERGQEGGVTYSIVHIMMYVDTGHKDYAQVHCMLH